MLGKMSIGVRRADPTPKIMISSAITMNVYGRRSASLTTPIMVEPRHQRDERVPSLGKCRLKPAPSKTGGYLKVAPQEMPLMARNNVTSGHFLCYLAI